MVLFIVVEIYILELLKKDINVINFRLLPKLWITCLVFVLIGQNVSAQTGVAKTGASSFNFTSKALSGQRTLDIYLPESYSYSNKTYPVIYLLDSDFLFDLTVGLLKTKWSRELAPEAIIVGIRTSSPQARLNFAMPIVRPDGSIFAKNAKPEAMATFFSDELAPFLSQHYRINNYRVGIGMSPTATNIVFDFLSASPFFDAHIAIASDLHFNTLSGQSFHSQIAKKANNKRFFLHSKASRDFINDPVGEKVYQQLAASTKHQKNNFYTLVPENSEHYAVSIETLEQAFNKLFPIDDWLPDYDKIRAENLPVKALMSFYLQRNEKAGFETYPLIDAYWSINSVIGLTQHLAGQGRFNEAAKLLEWANALSANEVLVHYYLSKVYAKLSQADKALHYAKEAVKLATEHDVSKLNRVRQQLKTLQNES